MYMEDRGLIFDVSTRPQSQRVAAFVTLCPMESGSLLSTFQSGPRKNDATSTLRICRSRDRGATWQLLPTDFETTVAGVPGSLSSGEMVEVEPGRLLLFATWFDRSDPDRPLFDPETEGILHGKQLRAVSTDEGDSWGPWEEVPTAGLRGCSITGPILKWPDGTIAVPFESYKEFDDPKPGHHGAWLLASRDAGRTFDDPLLVAQHPDHQVYYWDQRLCAGLGPGEFIAMFWSHDLKRKKDLSVHIRRAGIYQNDINQNDMDESPIKPTGIQGQIASPLLLPDGRLLAFVVDRGEPSTMTLWQSGDGGATWPRREALVVYTHQEQAPLSQGQEDVEFKQYWADMAKWSFGHPAIRPLDDDRVLLAFYAGEPDGMSIHWARVNTAR